MHFPNTDVRISPDHFLNLRKLSEAQVVPEEQQTNIIHKNLWTWHSSPSGYKTRVWSPGLFLAALLCTPTKSRISSPTILPDFLPPPLWSPLPCFIWTMGHVKEWCKVREGNTESVWILGRGASLCSTPEVRKQLWPQGQIWPITPTYK